MEFNKREIARGAVLTKLGLSSLVTTSAVDISAFHHAHVERQNIPARFIIDGLTIDAPAGIYHPTPDSSSLLFIRNMMAMDSTKIAKTLEIGAGCGAISLYVAARWNCEVTASDISADAVESVKRNAETNGLKINTLTSDLFNNIKEKDFDLIVFNAPLIDKQPESSVEKYSLCDPEGRIVGAFLREAGNHIKKSGLIIFSLCSNSAYEVMDGLGLRFKIVALELGYSGFWRAIVGAEI
ncbi:methyltransferase [Methylocapsa sp. S129]|uniref:methyltransferase n=1 Tax=Methylocapsa sp. S129 TaxID=1641869 RepID=UPI002110CFF5|nr:class I SAM-dependent methyltransferase [Methylocapsa sp. S129]